MFEKFIRWIREVVQKLFATPQDPNPVIDIALSSETARSIELWRMMYQNKAPWVLENKYMQSANLPSAIASEMARLVTLELSSTVSGSPRADYLNGFYQPIIDNLREQIEYGCALGGMIMKPYVTSSGLGVDFLQADSFFPISFDSSGKIIDCAFFDQIRRNNRIFTKLEIHRRRGQTIEVYNRVYVSSNDTSLGREIALTDVPEWAELAPEGAIENVDRSLFGYFRVPQANVGDMRSPLGASIYSRATELIKQADEQWSLFLWEFEGGSMAVDAALSMFKLDENGNPILPKGKERLYRQMDVTTGISEKPFFEHFAPQLRDSSYFNGFNRICQRIEFACGLAYGTISDPQMVEKTAEEIRSSKQRSYSTVTDNQKALQVALEDLVYAMDVWATLYKLAPQGKYEVSFDFDDSLVVDSLKEQQIMMQEAAAGLIRPEIYLMKRYGVSEQEALEMMPGVAPVDHVDYGEE